MKNIFLLAFISLSSLCWSQVENFSQETLNKFAKAYIEVRNENMNFQLNKLTAIEDAGLTSDEFTEIHISLQDPQSEKQPSATEKRLYDQALKNIENLQKDIQENMEQLITKNGLKVETYHAIAKASQKDNNLNQRLQKLIN